ncbi:MAG: secondary thiamine-phosphate synthase enzyme YjbQ [bacterium]|nr:secondary thiamine-phosphate synthase enzyme YjbQ [bacterium]MDT8396134.1 secondary thiamine-phosphate synthase enzyme YjbQ [bacterium]
MQTVVKLSTRRREELVDITSQVEDAIRSSGVSTGVCVLYCPHTTSALTINEGADPAVAADLVSGLRRLVPEGWDFSHAEGNSDAHLKASLFGASETILIEDGRPMLGTWQRIFYCEFDGPRHRTFYVRIEDQGGQPGMKTG